MHFDVLIAFPELFYARISLPATNLGKEFMLSIELVKLKNLFLRQKSKSAFVHLVSLYVFNIFPKYRKWVKDEYFHFRYWHNEFYYNNESRSPLTSKFFEDFTSCSKSDFWPTVRSHLAEIEFLVDLGAGVRQFSLVASKLHIVVESFDPYLSHLKNTNTDQATILVKEDVLEFLRLQATNSIDTFVVNDVIEHLPKDLGLVFIQELTRVVRNQILIFTPHGFMELHDSTAWGFSDNILQKHLSGWLPEEFENWSIVYCEDYHLEAGYENGAFAAIYKKNLRNPKSKDRVLAVFEGDTSSIEGVDSFNSFIEKCEVFKTSHEVDYLLQTDKANLGWNIIPGIKIPSGKKYYTSKNYYKSRFKFINRIFLNDWMDKEYSIIVVNDESIKDTLSITVNCANIYRL